MHTPPPNLGPPPGISAESAEVLRTLAKSTSLTEAGQKLSGHTVSTVKKEGPWPGQTKTNSKQLALKIRVAFEELNTALKDFQPETATPYEAQFLQHMFTKISSPNSAMAEAFDHALNMGGKKSVKAEKKIALTMSNAPNKQGLMPSKRSPTRDIRVVQTTANLESSLGKVQDHHQQTLMNAFAKARQDVVTPEIGSMMNQIEASLVLSLDKNIPVHLQAAFSPKGGEGTASGNYRIMGNPSLQPTTLPKTFDALLPTDPQNNVNPTPIAIVKPADQGLGGVHNTAVQHQLEEGIESFGQRLGQEVINTRTAYVLQQITRMPTQMYAVDATLLPHPSFGAPEPALLALKQNYGIDLSTRDALQLMNTARNAPGGLTPTSFRAALEGHMTQQGAGTLTARLQSSGMTVAGPGVQNQPLIDITPQSLRAAIALTKSTDQETAKTEFIAALALACHYTGDPGMLKTLLFGGSQELAPNYIIEIPPANAGVMRLCLEMATGNRAATGGQGPLYENSNQLLVTLQGPSPMKTGAWCSIQQWQPGGTLALDLNPQQLAEITPTAYGRIALVDGQTGNKDRFSNNIFTVPITRADLTTKVNERLPGLGEFIQNQLATIPIEDPRLQNAQKLVDDLLTTWEENNGEIDAQHLDVEWDVENLVTMHAKGADVCRDCGVIDMDLAMPDPDVSSGWTPSLERTGTNFWIGQPQAREAHIPSRTARHLASQNFRTDILPQLREEHARLQEAAGPENLDKTGVSESKYKALMLSHLVVQRGAVRGATYFELGLMKDGATIYLPENKTYNPGPIMAVIYNNHFKNRSIDEVDQDAVNKDIDAQYERLDKDLGISNGFNLIIPDQTRDINR